MGFFDKLLGKGQPEKAKPAPDAKAADDLPRDALAKADKLLAENKRAEAIAIYESLIAADPESGELLAVISGDLGRNRCLEEMITVVGPKYDAAIHGAETGINLVQAHLHLGQAEGAQMWIDILSALDRPDLVKRIAGFANAVAELRAGGVMDTPVAPIRGPEEEVSLISISKPLWTYVLPETEAYLPKKEGKLRTIAFAPLGASTVKGELLEESHVANAWARGFPFAVTEALAFAPTWQPKAIIALMSGNKLFTPPRGFGREQVRGLFAKGKDATDYAVTGYLDISGEELGVHLEVIDVRKDKTMKKLSASGPMATPDIALTKAFDMVRQYLEAAKLLPGPFEYVAPSPLEFHLVALDHAVSFFLVDKSVTPPESLRDPADRIKELDTIAAASSNPVTPLVARGARTIFERL